MTDKLKKLYDKADELFNNPSAFTERMQIPSNAIREGDNVEFMRERTFGVAWVVKSIHPLSLEPQEKIEYQIACVCRDWKYKSDITGWTTGGWIGFDLKGLSEEDTTHPLYAELCAKIASKTGIYIEQKDALIEQIVNGEYSPTNSYTTFRDDVDSRRVLSTHTFKGGKLPLMAGLEGKKKKPYSVVEYNFNQELTYKEWRMFEWMSQKLVGRYALSVVETEFADRLPYPMIRSSRKIFFEHDSDATLFKLKYL